jgi:small-conductance mechanosensitive channel
MREVAKVNDGLNIRYILDVIVDSFKNGLTVYLPRALMAIVIFLLGWLFAKILQKVLQTILSRARIDNGFERIGGSAALSRIGIKDKLSRLLPKIIYYLILIFILRLACLSAGLIEIADAINTAMAYIPHVVAALIILLVGNIVGQFAGKVVENAARDSGVDYASVLGKLTSTLILFIVMIMAIAQLKINTNILNSVVLIVFAGFGLAFALSFGLGTREITRNMMAGFYIRKTFKIDTEVEINGQRGILKSVSSLVTMLESKGRSVAIPNSDFLNSVNKK